MYMQRVTIRSFEKGLLFKNREFRKILEPGRHWCIDPTGQTKVDIVSTRDPWLVHSDLDLIVASGTLAAQAQVIDLADNQRGLVWIDNRFSEVLAPGRYAIWKGLKQVRLEIVDAAQPRFAHPELRTILECASAADKLFTCTVAEGMVGVLFIDGMLKEVLPAGCHAFWHKTGKVEIKSVDTRESMLDVGGQEIMSRDKVSLRLNGQTTYKVIDPIRAVTSVGNFEQSLYRETQLALRAAVGTREIDELLADKDALTGEVRQMIACRANDFGVEIMGFGIRDIILPGEMKELLNRVIASKKAAEVNLITRREETAAMRSQANTAKLLADNPTLMRLRELELLEKVAASSNLNIVCGDGPITDRVIKLI